MNRISTLAIVAVAGLALATSAHADLILAMDGGGSSKTATSHSTVMDFSTGSDTIGSITGTFLASADADWATTDTNEWNNTSFAFNSDTPGRSATWTISGLAEGSQWQVYTTWRKDQYNRSTAAPYSINAGATITVNQKLDPLADLVLADPDATGMDFQAIGGIVTVDGSEQIVVRQDSLPGGAGTDWVMIDGVALKRVAIPEPGSLALLGLGGLMVMRRRG